MAVGVSLSLALLRGPVTILPNVTLDTHSLIVACFAILVGVQCLSVGIIARRYATSRGFLPAAAQLERLRRAITLERVLIASGVLASIGLGGLGYSIWTWAAADFGPLQYGGMIRVLVLSCTLIALGLQIAFIAFFAALLDLDATNVWEDERPE